jgi:hypothetical protein
MGPGQVQGFFYPLLGQALLATEEMQARQKEQ